MKVKVIKFIAIVITAAAAVFLGINLNPAPIESGITTVVDQASK